VAAGLSPETFALVFVAAGLSPEVAVLAAEPEVVSPAAEPEVVVSVVESEVVFVAAEPQASVDIAVAFVVLIPVSVVVVEVGSSVVSSPTRIYIEIKSGNISIITPAPVMITRAIPTVFP
jgi:hypothetical protein